jgi:hypothetical protein
MKRVSVRPLPYCDLRWDSPAWDFRAQRLLMRRFLSILVLAATALLPGCTKREPRFARVDAALAPLLPGDTVALACLRLDRLKDTPFYKKYIAGGRIKALDEFALKTGLDPRESVWELVFSTNGRTPYLFIRGKFGGEFGFEPDFKTPGLQRQSYKGRYLLYSGDSGVLFMNTGAAVAGKVADLKALVDGFDDAKRPAPQALLDVVATLPGTSHIWAVSLRPASLAHSGEAPESSGGMAGNLMRAGSRVSQVKMWADISQGLDMHVEAVAASPNDAAELRDTFKAAVGMGRLGAQNSQPDMLSLYDGLSSSSDGSIVRIEVKEPFDVLDTFLDKLSLTGATPKK